jgi:predicted HTH transcriptional regulator
MTDLPEVTIVIPECRYRGSRSFTTTFGEVTGGVPNLAGLLLFGKAPQVIKPAFVIKAVAFPGTELHDNRYLDSEDIDGNLFEQYRRGIAFT